jgi:hypothetical protein
MNSDLLRPYEIIPRFTVVVLLTVFLPACATGQTSPHPILEQSSTPVVETIDEFFARCPTADEVARVDADLTVTFEYDPTAGALACHSPELTPLQKRAYQTLYVMQLLEFSRPLPWTDKQLFTWFVDTIDGVRFVEGGYSHCCEPENTIVIALYPDSIILQTDRWIVDSQNYGLMNSMLLYAHEARHNEGFPHTCSARNGDDNTIDEMGAWTIQYYLALWIAQYGDRAFLHAPGDDPAAYRRAALEDADVTRLTRFCREDYSELGPTLIP